MAKDAKAAHKRARDTGGAAPKAGDRAERTALKRVRRLEAELADARRTQARRRKQLAAAEKAVQDVIARIAEFAAGSKGAAAQAADRLLSTTGGSGSEGVAPAEPVAAPEHAATAPNDGGDTAMARTPARRARRPRGAASPAAATTAARRRTRVAAAPATGIGGGADTPRSATRRRSARAAASVEAPVPTDTGEPLAAAEPVEPAAIEPATVESVAAAVEPAAVEPAAVEPAAAAPAEEATAPAGTPEPVDVGSAEDASAPAETPEPVESSAAVEPAEGQILDEGATGEDGGVHEARRFLRPGEDDLPDGG